jgi:adenosine deaminase
MAAGGDLRVLPKGHLHYHLELCMRDSTLDSLCRQHGVDRAATPMGTLPRCGASSSGGGFTSFDEFGVCGQPVMGLVRRPEDLERVILEMAEDARAEGVVYIEPAFGTAELHAGRWGSSPRAVWCVPLPSAHHSSALPHS